MNLHLDNARIFAKHAGSGDPLLMLHGVPDSADLWDGIIAGVSDCYRCIAPDLPGFARSDVWPAMRFDFDGYAELVDRLLVAEGITGKVSLALHDWGGIIGYCWACKNPERVERIVCADFPFSHLYRWHAWAQVWRAPIVGELAMLSMNWPLFKREVRRGSRRLSDYTIRQMYEHAARRPETRDTTLRLYRSAVPANWTAWGGRVQRLGAQVPITVLWGAEDVYVPSWNARMLGSNDVRILKGVGHWVPSEAPEAFIEALREPVSANAAAA